MSENSDRGYFKGEEILACHEAGITAFVPKALTSGAAAVGRFGKGDFIYDATENEYRCPSEQSLIWRYSSVEKGLKLHRYWSPHCQGCALKEHCTPSSERRVSRWGYESVLDAMQARLDLAPEMMRIRHQTEEHPFGKLKAWMRAQHSLTRALDPPCTEMKLHVLAYCFNRVLKLLGDSVLMAAIKACPSSAALHGAVAQISGKIKLDAPRAQVALRTKETAQQPDIRYRSGYAWPGPIADASLRPLRQERL